MPLGVRSKIAFAVGVALQRERRRDLDRVGCAGSRRAGRRSLLRDQDVEPRPAFEPTASIVDRGVYEHPAHVQGGDVSRPVLMAARGYRATGGGRTYVRPAPRHRFADGTPMTAADVVFSFRRLINLKGNPAFLLSGVTPSARGRYGRAPLEDAEHRDPVDRREHVSRDRELEAGEAARCHRQAQRGQDRQGRAMVQLTGFGGRRKRAVRADQYSTTSQIVLDEIRGTGERSQFEQVVDPEHGLRHAVHQRSAGPA